MNSPEKAEKGGEPNIGPVAPREDEQTCAAISARLTVLEGTSQGTVVVVDCFPAIVGRGVEADIQLVDDPDSPTISRSHLRLSVASGRLIVEDLSTNGTSLEGRLLRPGETAVLKAQETLWLGPRTALLIETLRPKAARETPASEPPSVRQGVPPLSLEVVTLGACAVRVGGRTMEEDHWKQRKALLLLVYLAGASPHPVPIVRLWEVFWPDQPESGRQGLQTAVSRLRKVFRELAPGTSLPNPVVFQNQAYGLNSVYGPEIDALLFERACLAARQAQTAGNVGSAQEVWRRALGLYGGDFLKGFQEDWVERRRLQLRQIFLQSLDGLSGVLLGEGEAQEALELYRRGLEQEPGWEAGHLGALRALVRLGRKHEAVFQFQECERVMRRLYGETPSPEILRFYHSELGG